MHRSLILLILSAFLVRGNLIAQDSLKQVNTDTSFIDYDELFNELDVLLDSLAAPRNFLLFNVGVGKNFFNYESKSSYLLETYRKVTYTPSIAFYSKSGLGISGSAIVVNDGVHLNPYQFYFTGSYDYMRNNRFITGIALTHFFTKDSLPFYTSPLKNEVYAYFVYKKCWIKPSIALSYGWGARSDFEERQDYITSLRLG